MMGNRSSVTESNSPKQFVVDKFVSLNSSQKSEEIRRKRIKPNVQKDKDLDKKKSGLERKPKEEERGTTDDNDEEVLPKVKVKVPRCSAERILSIYSKRRAKDILKITCGPESDRNPESGKTDKRVSSSKTLEFKEETQKFIEIFVPDILRKDLTKILQESNYRRVLP